MALIMTIHFQDKKHNHDKHQRIRNQAKHNTLVITKSDKSIRFMRRSEMVFLTYSAAPGTSLSISILLRLSVTRFLTSKQLSLRTVSIPARDIWSENE